MRRRIGRREINRPTEATKGLLDGIVGPVMYTL
jgi:hypothetical protein